ncbi:MAG: hypothetical protein M1825_003046 [Sarcosagium campestre]|nr:MAG: hypothetical protein M1825_003046 [Sarcosagium campestre]
MESRKCVHTSCGKIFTDENEDCVYHPGPPVFHEGQKGWKCCKPRVLTFDEFLAIPACTTGKHSTKEDIPPPIPQAGSAAQQVDAPKPKPILTESATQPVPPPPRQARSPHPTATASAAPAEESESDDPELPVKSGTICRRRGCGTTYRDNVGRDGEECVHHPGQALFHEGSKGWTCCKRRVLEFDEFMRIKGCKTKSRHLFVGSGRSKMTSNEAQAELVNEIRNDFYQTPASVIVSLFLKKVDASVAKIEFTSSSVELDLRTSDSKRHTSTMPLYGSIDAEKSTFKILGTKVELTLAKADGQAWPVLRSDEKDTGEILQVGRAGIA